MSAIKGGIAKSSYAVKMDSRYLQATKGNDAGLVCMYMYVSLGVSEW